LQICLILQLCLLSRFCPTRSCNTTHFPYTTLFRSFDEHNFNFLAGYSYEDNYYQKNGAQNRQFVTDFFDYDNLGAGENLRPSDVDRKSTRLNSSHVKISDADFY